MEETEGGGEEEGRGGQEKGGEEEVKREGERERGSEREREMPLVVSTKSPAKAASVLSPGGREAQELRDERVMGWISSRQDQA